MTVQVPFALVDVFATAPLEGNPLALVPDADALPVERMRAVAREFNQSETTFLVRPTAPGALWRLRSFTPAGIEVFGAGHNAMGAWLWLALTDRLPAAAGRYRQQIGDDVLGVEVGRTAGRVEVTMEQSPPVFGRVQEERTALAAALGLAPADLSPDPAQVASTGAAHLLAPLRSPDLVGAVSPDPARLLPLLAGVGAEGCYVYAVHPAAAPGSPVASARFFNPTVGIAEDPATGTAAGPLAARLVRDGVVADGVPAAIEQGRALGRPSLLRVTVSGAEVRLSGSGVIAAEGTLRLTP